MKTTFAAAFTLFAAALAAPTTRIARPRQVAFPEITVSLSNDLTGASGSAKVIADGTPYPIPSLFKDTPIDVNDQFFASSAQLTNFVNNVFCIFKDGAQEFLINDIATFVDFDRNDSVAKPIDLSEFTFQCEI